MKHLFLFLIRLYQRFLSPRLQRSCRFDPSCSAYSAQAFARYGSFVGLGLCLWRILRCNPFGRCGKDPLP